MWYELPMTPEQAQMERLGEQAGWIAIVICAATVVVYLWDKYRSSR